MRIMGNNFGSRAAFQHQIYNKVYKVSDHIHQYAELIFMLEGEMRITVDDREEYIKAGEAAFIFPYQTHKMTSKSVNKLAMYLFSPATIVSFMKKHEGNVGERAVFKPSESTLAVFREKILDNNDFSLYNVKGFLYLALNDYISTTPLRKSIGGTSVVSKVITYMNEHFTEPITLDSVASALGYSANYLSHCIRKLYGLNFCTILASLRIERARYLITSSDKTTTEIGYECGFGSERTFLRQFKSIMGFSPSEYRKKFFLGPQEQPKTNYFE